jgi:hypothetical protein
MMVVMLVAIAVRLVVIAADDVLNELLRAVED